ncbi:AEC family transporter [Kurthia sibirica]|uniref:AEC family transporter n=1 Tax=Kurthia sibirica TaxID=202750 RepID=A0A2U3AIZ0_9BACL|nr:AEC family transporter [Kurthia sibirica]PWI24522.1 hypothetical protein DEX24_13095 [Kurthia sibirica]GEK33591.1 membrane protein [Kurthia sibirica]
MSLFLIILPVILVFLTGFIGQKALHFDIKNISTLTLYVMSPVLAFRTFYTTPLTPDYMYIILFAVLLCFMLFIVTWLTTKLIHADRSESSAMMLGAVFMNSGNYGAPVALFAFGQEGFHIAVIIMVLHSLLMNTLGIFFASMGSDDKPSLKTSLSKVYTMPVLWGAVIGLAMQLIHIPLHESILNGVDLIADASIPVVMLILGMQLAVISRKKVNYTAMATTTSIRMIISPLLAAAILFFMPLPTIVKSVLILQAAMPAAANTTMLALQFNTKPDLVSFTTFITTAISIFSIPIVLFFLGV